MYELKIMDLTGNEMDFMIKLCDKTNRGYIGIDHFVAKIQEWAVETKVDVMLRRFANSLKH